MFDEVTSALDNKIRTIIDRGGVGQLACTQVAIAHVLDTTRRPCQFFLIKTGAVVEDGTRGELVARTRGSAELIFRRVA